MQAVILAAGMGTRLGAVAEGRPKCLLQFGGAPLVEWTLRALRAAGVEGVLVVVGHRAEDLRRALGGAAETVLNERFAATNNLASFLLAEAWVRSDVFVLNADVLFDPRILFRLVAAGPDHVAIDSRSANREEAMKVRIRAERVELFSKQLSFADSAGESVGVVFLSRSAASGAFALGRGICAGTGRSAYLGEALAPLRLRGVDVADLPWIEIDAPADLERARTVVWPAVSATVAQLAVPGREPSR